MSSSVLVLDLTHGGEVLAKEYARRGYKVTAVDIYHTASQDLKDSLADAGIEVLAEAPDRTFNLGIVPIHCPDSFIKGANLQTRLTSHEAVGTLASFKYPTVEITGVWGKTSACHILAHILVACGKKVLLHTSRGRGLFSPDGTTVLKDKVSIAPPSVLDASLSDIDADIGIFEVSIGGTGLADVSAITSLGNNYPIAAGTKKAFDGKVQMINSAKGKVVFPSCEFDIWSEHIPDNVSAITFGSTSSDVDLEKSPDILVKIPDTLTLGEKVPIEVMINNKLYKVDLQDTYLVPSYAISISTALSCAYALNIDMEKAVSSLSSFTGVLGRGEVVKEKGWFRIIDRNPGVSAGSIAWNLNTLENYYKQNDIGLILDPVNIKVCEKLDLAEVDRILSTDENVTGQYLMNMPGFDHPGFRRIDSFMDVRGKHAVLMCCIKEGYL